jgi:general secretion pathway protein E
MLDTFVPSSTPTIETILTRRNLLAGAALERVRRLEAESGERIDRIAAKLGLLSDTDLAAAYAELLGTPRLTAADRLGKTFLKTARVIPIAETDTHLTVAMADPLDDTAARVLAFALDKPIIRRIALPADIEAAFERLYGTDPQATPTDLTATVDEDRDTDLERLKGVEGPVM